MDHWSAFAVLGLLAGIISGTLGVGSGLVLIPALVLIFHLPQKSAQGISLAVMVPMALVGAIRYRLDPTVKVDLRIVGQVAMAAVVGAFIGSYLMGVLPAKVLKKAFAVFLILVATRILWPKSSAQKTPSDQDTAADAGKTGST